MSLAFVTQLYVDESCPKKYHKYILEKENREMKHFSSGAQSRKTMWI